MSIRIAIIGAGFICADRPQIVPRQIPGATLQFICDVGTARAKIFADSNGAADVAEPDVYETPKGNSA